MTEYADDHLPDMRDKHRRLLAFAVLAMATRYAALTVSHFVGPDLARYLDYVNAGGALLAVALILPIMWWKIRKLPHGLRHVYFSEDGFVAEAISRAHLMSWGAGFFVLLFSEIAVGDKDFTIELPAGFYLQLALAVMLGTFGIAFLILSRDDLDDADRDSLSA